MRTVAGGEDTLRGRLQTLLKRQDLRPIPKPARSCSQAARIRNDKADDVRLIIALRISA